MADPSFAEMESEVETLLPPDGFSRAQDDKSNLQPHFETDQAETSPLLGPPVLSEQAEKTWYNTPSVSHLIWHG